MDVLKNSNSLILLCYISTFTPKAIYYPYHFGSDSKESVCNAEDLGLVPGLGRFPEENVNPLQQSSLENSTDRGAWQATVHGIAKSWTRLSD